MRLNVTIILNVWGIGLITYLWLLLLSDCGRHRLLLLVDMDHPCHSNGLRGGGRCLLFGGHQLLLKSLKLLQKPGFLCNCLGILSLEPLLVLSDLCQL